MSASFGARLREQRERQQVTLSAIAEQTKIRRSLLEDLERDNVSQWPHGVFRRAYLRHYARAIGLDPEATLREFLERHPDPVEDDAAVIAAHAAAVSGHPNGRPRTRLRYLFDSAIGALPIIGQSGHKEDAAGETASPAIEQETSAVSSVDRADAHQSEAVAVTEFERSAEGAPVGATETVVANTPPPVVESPAMSPPDVDLAGMARLCTRLAQTRLPDDVALLLADAARILHAVGIIVWAWDPNRGGLEASFCHGYSDDVVGHLPVVRADADNAIAASFRAVELRVVGSGSSSTGAVVVPVTTPAGCAGVLALELRSGNERDESVHALARILAAQLSSFIEAPPLARSAIA